MLYVINVNSEDVAVFPCSFFASPNNTPCLAPRPFLAGDPPDLSRPATSVRRARVPHVRRQRRRHDRLPGVPVRALGDVTRPTRAEAQVGLLHVRPGRQRLHQPARDAGDRHGEAMIESPSG